MHAIATIPPFLLITLYHKDLVIYNKENSSIIMLELTCPIGLDSSSTERLTAYDKIKRLEIFFNSVVVYASVLEAKLKCFGMQRKIIF